MTTRNTTATRFGALGLALMLTLSACGQGANDQALRDAQNAQQIAEAKLAAQTADARATQAEQALAQAQADKAANDASVQAAADAAAAAEAKAAADATAANVAAAQRAQAAAAAARKQASADEAAARKARTAAANERTREAREARAQARADAAAAARNNSEPVYTSAPAPAVCNDCGTVVAINPVRTQGTSNVPVGAALGAIAGGVLGHQVGGGRGRDIATAAGAIAGGLAGNEVQKRTTGATVYDVTVRMDGGGTQTARVGDASTLSNGSRVRVNGNNLQRI